MAGKKCVKKVNTTGRIWIIFVFEMFLEVFDRNPL